MSKILRYLSHPQVKIDAAIPVPEWGLSDLGKDRAKLFARSKCLLQTKSVYSSAETKAIETGNTIAKKLGLNLNLRPGTHENDRSATGFLKPDEFETVANAFFAAPYESVRGWERAIDAQKRIVEETRQIIEDAVDGDILMVGHGGVGTLLLCHFAGLAISRERDQPAGGGNVFAVDLSRMDIIHPWRRLEDI
ncbi:MAG: histidine phosphatase family protein [Pseudomonadota bacterium]